MGTRGSVAWYEDGDVIGVYNHWDSYPTALGMEVWEAAQEYTLQGLIDMLKEFGDWREFSEGGVCEYCGKVAGQAHTINAVTSGFFGWTRDEFIQMRKEQGRTDKQIAKEIEPLDEVEANIKSTGYPDPEVKYHTHGNGKADQYNPFDDPLFMEWIYVLVPEKNEIEVWHFCQYTEKLRESGLQVSIPVPLDFRADTSYCEVMVGTWKMNEPMPFFRRFEEQAEKMTEEREN